MAKIDTEWLGIIISTYSGEVMGEYTGSLDTVITDVHNDGSQIWQDCEVSFYIFDDADGYDGAYELVAYLDLDFVVANDPELVKDHIGLISLECEYLR